MKKKRLVYNPPFKGKILGGGRIETNGKIGAGTGKKAKVDIFSTGDGGDINLGRGS
jgi:hypothetical protein